MATGEPASPKQHHGQQRSNSSADSSSSADSGFQLSPPSSVNAWLLKTEVDQTINTQQSGNGSHRKRRPFQSQQPCSLKRRNAGTDLSHDSEPTSPASASSDQSVLLCDEGLEEDRALVRQQVKPAIQVLCAAPGESPDIKSSDCEYVHCIGCCLHQHIKCSRCSCNVSRSHTTPLIDWLPQRLFGT